MAKESKAMAYYRSCVAAGRCKECAKPAWRANSPYCTEHLAKQRGRVKGYATARIEKGKCVRCATRTKGGARHCEPHRVYTIAYMKSRRANGKSPVLAAKRAMTRAVKLAA